MRTQLLGISNAIVDVLGQVDDEFLSKIGAAPGSMTLLDEPRAHEIYDMMGPTTEMSGGSVANTVAGFANLGGSAAYIGKVRDDQLGEIFIHDMRSLGVDVRLPPANGGAATARSHILITPDGQRTMQTYLGACTELAAADITSSTVGSPAITLLEGYVWDIAEGPALVAAAVEMVHRQGGKVALSLSDAQCVARHQATFAAFVRDSVDIVFADEDEVMALFGASDFEQVMDQLAGTDKLFVTTRSEKGSVIVENKTRIVQSAMPVKELVDSTGAGDAYTAGFLYGLSRQRSLEDCARLGTLCATTVIQQVGARIPAGTLKYFD